MKLGVSSRFGLVAALSLTFACTANADGAAPAQVDLALRGPAAPPLPGPRGELLQVVALRSLSAAEVRDNLTQAGFDDSEVRYGAELYRLVYATVDPRGRGIAASGLVVLPASGETRLRIVSFAHGTEVYKGDTPSVSQDGWETGPALTYASAGFAAVAPDYLGLGVGPGPHPWMHLPTEISASLDLLRAARAFVGFRGRAVDEAVFLTGFSQGAFAALGLGRAVERGEGDGFRLAALAPISGPYDWTGSVRTAAEGGEGTIAPKWATLYLAYLSVAWNRIYGLYASPSDFFLTPYDGFIDDLFDSTHQGSEVVARTPDSPDQLFTPAALARFITPDPTLASHFAEIDAVCGGWSPRAPTRLYAASGDDQVPFANSERCLSALRARGVRASLVDLGNTDHLGSNRLAAVQVLRFFAQTAD